jgi:hypothetical protein
MFIQALLFRKVVKFRQRKFSGIAFEFKNIIDFVCVCVCVCF